LTVSPTATPTDYNPSVFHRELKKFYVIVPQSPTDIPTDCNPSVFHRALKKIYGIVPQSPIASPIYITDGLRTSQSARMSEAWSIGTITDGFADGSKSLAGFSNFFGANIN
jgi:AraC-like DNA-binding protein